MRSGNPPAMTTKNVSRHGQMFPAGQKDSRLRTGSDFSAPLIQVYPQFPLNSDILQNVLKCLIFLNVIC